MSFDLTELAQSKASGTFIEPQLVLEIEGVDTFYGARIVKKKVRIGDPGLVIGDPNTNPDAFFIGGLKELEDQEDLISLQRGTTTEIRQSLRQDKGTGEDISSMQVALVDKSLKATKLITPDTTQSPVFDIMGRRARLWLGFDETAFKEDFNVIFRGIVDNVTTDLGIVTISLAHPDSKKRSEIFIQTESDLFIDFPPAATVITVDDASKFKVPYIGPDGLNDTSLKLYLKINDEVVRYTGIVGNQFQNVTRGELGSVEALHEIGDTVTSFYRLEGSAMDLALKLMLSGHNGDFQVDVQVKNFVRVSLSELIPESLFFDFDLEREYNLRVGDYVSSTGASNGANNFSLKKISGIVTTEFGSYLTLEATALVEENDTSALVSFRSQYDTLGEGLKMHNDEVDIAEHDRIKSLFLSSQNYDFYLKDTINGKTFISEQIYNPGAAFSIPRKAQSSVGYHIGPIPGQKVKIFTDTNVKNASTIRIQRSTSKNFFNSVIYKFDLDSVEDRFLSSVVTINTDSLDRIPVGNKPLTIESLGMRTALQAQSQANLATSRRLKKFKFGAEFIQGLKVSYGDGFNLEIGDIIILELTALKIADIQTGTRSGESRLFEIMNKSLNIKTGDISIDLIDTSFDKDQRFGLISPGSKIRSGTSGTQFVIKESYNSPFGQNEFKKWEDYIGTGVRIHNAASSIVGTSTILNIIGNTIVLSSDLGFTPQENYLMELDVYNTQIDNVKLLYSFMTDNATFSDGKVQYKMI